MRKRVTFAVATALLLSVAETIAAQGSNAPLNTIPTLDGVGLATLVGGLAMTGAWAMARARRKK